MSLDGLLAFAGILIAIFGIADSVQRESLRLFIPLRLLVVLLLLAFGFVVIRDAVDRFCPGSEQLSYLLGIVSFVTPIGALLLCWRSWDRASLPEKAEDSVTKLLAIAVLENRFGEVERVLQRNQDRLSTLSEEATVMVFERKVVESLLESRSWLHLHLIQDWNFIASLKRPSKVCDPILRELLETDFSPIRCAVVCEYGGDEFLHCAERASDFIAATVQNPEWYKRVNAHYAFTMAAIEKIESGAFDGIYNRGGREYQRSQGVSTRSRCPVYLALKTEVLAIREAIDRRSPDDFYVTDLWNIFEVILYQSHTHDWRSPQAEAECPTPFSYLMAQILYDLKDLFRRAIDVATSREVQWHIAEPDGTAEQIARSWGLCVWEICSSDQQVSEDFATRRVADYLDFVLELGWAQERLYTGVATTPVQGMEAWRDLLISELVTVGFSKQSKAVLRRGFERVDWLRASTSGGRSWLAAKLGLENEESGLWLREIEAKGSNIWTQCFAHTSTYSEIVEAIAGTH